MEKRQLKLYQGIILLVLCAVYLFGISPIISGRLGLFGTLLGEVVMLLLAFGTVLVSRADMRTALPLKKPRLSRVFGTLILWIGAFLTSMIFTLVLARFFPQQVLGTSVDLGQAFVSVALVFAIPIVAITPAICEEAVFRGVFLHSLQGRIRNKWIIIVITGVVFGAFHGSIWRFFPTAILGMVMAYLVIETDNMFYNAMFHAVNNLVPLLAMFALENLMGGLTDLSVDMTEIPLISIGVYVLYGCAVPFLLYIGNYLIHMGDPGYQHGLFPKEKQKTLTVLLLISFAIAVIGIAIIALGFVFESYLLWQYL